MNRDKDVSPELERQMFQISTYSMFAAAQIQAQNDMYKYFCGNTEFNSDEDLELARCLLQSQTNVYTAWCEVIEVQKVMEKRLLLALSWLYEKKHITERLEAYVETAQKDGAINSKEAEAILHPLHEQIAECLRRIHQTTDGVKRNSLLEQEKAALDAKVIAKSRGSAEAAPSPDAGKSEAAGAPTSP